MIHVTPQLVRRLAVVKQQLAKPQLSPTKESVHAIMQALSYLQIDPVRAVERTQFLVLWSRLGQYDRDLLGQLAYEDREIFEYWAHAAAYVLTEHYDLHRAIMDNFTEGKRKYDGHVRDWLKANSAFKDYVVGELNEKGPLGPRAFEDRAAVPWHSTGWTGGRNVDRMLGFLWERGDIVVVERDGLKKKWALSTNYFDESVTSKPRLSAESIAERAILLSLKALGIATVKQIKRQLWKGFYRALPATLPKMIKAGLIVPVTVEGNSAEFYMLTDDIPALESLQQGNWSPRTTLLSPFDNLIIDRDRTEMIWDFYYRMEIYVPAAKRQYGFYVLPILHGENLIGRISPRMDRKTGILTIDGVYAEPTAPNNKRLRKAVSNAVTELATFLEAKQINYTCDEPIPFGLG